MEKHSSLLRKSVKSFIVQAPVQKQICSTSGATIGTRIVLRQWVKLVQVHEPLLQHEHHEVGRVEDVRPGNDVIRLIS
jgi:hypothetical protein